jgi:eukaryotic-like serine/threonine-protein kinase
MVAAVDRYRELCPLASGGMAELHLARMSGLGGFERLVVVKRLRAQYAGAPDLVQMLLDEARIAATLQHGNIVQVHDVAIEHGSVSIVMEYLHGQDVRTVMRRARTACPGGLVALDQAIAIVLGVCAGLHHAHDQVGADGTPLDIVHRDVSAENVFITYDGGVKLIDFGIARARSRLGHTDHGVIKGKPGYMAPEQITCSAVDRRADVHAAAVLLYELTCGTRPRAGATDQEQFKATIDDDPIPPRTAKPGYPAALQEIVLRGLARDPEQRYRTAQELGRALEQFARGQGLDLSSFGLATVMEQLFGDKLAAWRTAQQSGHSLADHVAALRMSTVDVDVAGVAAPTPKPAPFGRRRRMAYILLSSSVAVGVAAAIVVSKAQSSERSAAAAPLPAPEPAIEPAPVEVAPVEVAPAPAPAPIILVDAAPAAPVVAPTAVDKPTKRRVKKRAATTPEDTTPVDPDALLPH